MSNSNIGYGGFSNANTTKELGKREKYGSKKHASPSHSLITKQSTKKKEKGYSLATVLTMAIQRKKTQK